MLRSTQKLEKFAPLFNFIKKNQLPMKEKPLLSFRKESRHRSPKLTSYNLAGQRTPQPNALAMLRFGALLYTLQLVPIM